MLLKHFSGKELRCRCGCSGQAPDPCAVADLNLLIALEKIRERVGRPVYINSGYRCEKYNQRVGGVKNSYHVRKMAADIWVKDLSPKELANVIDDLFPSSCGIGIYRSFVHFDVRENKTRFKGD